MREDTDVDVTFTAGCTGEDDTSGFDLVIGDVGAFEGD
jgi:hypothetical protein